MRNTWFSRELPILEVVIGLFEEKGWAGGIVQVSEISDRTGIDGNEVFTALCAMENEYVILQKLMTGGDPNPQMVTGVTPSARRAVGQWPSIETFYDRIIAGLTEAEEQETDVGKKSKLRSTLNALTDLGRDTLITILSNTITRGLGIP